MEFYIINSLFYLVSNLLFFAVALLFYAALFGKPPRKLIFLACLAVTAMTLVNIKATNGPRFILHGDSGTAPIIDGPVSKHGMELLEFDERLKYNQELYDDTGR